MMLQTHNEIVFFPFVRSSLEFFCFCFCLFFVLFIFFFAVFGSFSITEKVSSTYTQ